MENKVRLGLGMIVKDEVEEVKRILSQFRYLFDEVQITITSPLRKDELEKTISEFGGTPSYFEWNKNFADARNFNKAQFKESDYYFRLDADDEIVNPQFVREITQKAKNDGVSIVYCWYDYSKDQWGNTNAGHYRESIIKIDDNLFWNKRIHENVLPKEKSNYSIAIDENVKINHLIDAEHAYLSGMRNIEYLLEEYKEDKEATDPRTIAYLGRVFMSVGEFEKAIFFLNKHIEKSGWDEDRYMSWTQLAEIYRQNGDLKNAESCCYEAISERVDYPDAYLKLHDIFFDQESWKNACHWGEIGLAKKRPQSMMICDPSAYTWRPMLSMSLTYFHLGNFEKAYKLFNLAKSYVPTLDFIKNNEGLFREGLENAKFAERFQWIVGYLREREPEKIGALALSIPSHLLEEPAFIALRNQYVAQKDWDSNSIAIFCGQAWEEWSPKSIESGIGGSEEAVINIAKELTKLGWNVTVFNSCGKEEGLHDGVNYVNYYKFNKRDIYNILISWRCNIFKLGAKANKKIVWLHDVPEYIFNDYDDKISFDKVLVLSEYHKSLLAGKVEEEKIYVSANGVDVSQFEIEGIERNPKRMIYASSYDRGIEHLLSIWPEIKSEVPEAELHLYYGWNTYDKMFKEGAVDGKFKERMLHLLKQDGVFEHGRIGHKELAIEYLKSGVWVYPSHFPEISCISAMKAQVAGCVPICTDYAALKETVKAGIIIPGSASNPEVMKDFKSALIETLKNTEAQDYVRDVVVEKSGSFSWAKVAEDWTFNLIPDMNDRLHISCRFEWVKSKCSLDDKIVDIGGNDGHTFDGWNRDNVTTVDIDEYEIPNFIKGDAQNLPLPDKSFDVSCLNEILEHIPDPVQALKEASRVTKKKIIITVPNEHEWPKCLDPKMTIEDKEKKEGKSREVLAMEANPKAKTMYKIDNLEHLWHIRYYDKSLLESHLESAGLTNYVITKLQLGDWAFYGAEVFLDE